VRLHRRLIRHDPRAGASAGTECLPVGYRQGLAPDATSSG